MPSVRVEHLHEPASLQNACDTQARRWRNMSAPSLFERKRNSLCGSSFAGSVCSFTSPPEASGTWNRADDLDCSPNSCDWLARAHVPVGNDWRKTITLKAFVRSKTKWLANTRFFADLLGCVCLSERKMSLLWMLHRKSHRKPRGSDRLRPWFYQESGCCFTHIGVMWLACRCRIDAFAVRSRRQTPQCDSTCTKT